LRDCQTFVGEESRIDVSSESSQKADDRLIEAANLVRLDLGMNPGG
jgi:hypothetical protein